MSENQTKKPSEFALVSAMNSAFGNPAGDPSAYRPGPSAPGLRDVVYNETAWNRLRRQLSNVMDEIYELRTALNTGSITAVRDALCDIRVFAYGGLHFIGYDFDHPDNTVGRISINAPIPAMMTKLHPVTSLTAAYEYMMDAVNERDLHTVIIRIGLVIWAAHEVSHRLAIPGEQQLADMDAVIEGVMTRFIKDEADAVATRELFAAKGVTDVYFEGSYPTGVMKSGSDQPDAPAGKFLKSASYRDTVFAELANAEEVQAKINLWS